MQQELLGINEVEQLISEDRPLLIAGDENLLKKLPQGKWIGGTIPYFIAPGTGGLIARDKLFVTDISAVAASATITVYDQNGLGSVYTDAGTDGFSFIIIPASSSTHISFAINAPNYKNFGSQPLIGWIAGVHLDDLGKISPKVFNGETGESYLDEALVMHVDLVPGKTVDVGIINIFEQGDGDTLTFTGDGFSASEVMVNGIKENFADYITANNLDIQLPLVADYYGALVNISFQSVDPGTDVQFYAPVFTGVRYKHARPVTDYAEAFKKQLEESGACRENITFSCNCILNYLYSGLEGKQTDPFVGPITFGEIAYQLMNQTLVYLKVHED